MWIRFISYVRDQLGAIVFAVIDLRAPEIPGDISSYE